jgi:hypothetical protein
LIHCFRGADRTGLASTIAKLLRTDADLPDALQELTINFGHVRIGKVAQLDRFFQLYGPDGPPPKTPAGHRGAI